MGQQNITKNSILYNTMHVENQGNKKFELMLMKRATASV